MDDLKQESWDTIHSVMENFRQMELLGLGFPSTFEPIHLPTIGCEVTSPDGERVLNPSIERILTEDSTLEK